MNLNFDEFEQCDADSNNPSNQEHGRYQLLSAYLDGEVTVDERRQVQEWLDSDVTFQQQYRKLQQLKQSIPRIPIPQGEISPEELSMRVFAKIDHQRIRRLVLCSSLLLTTVATSLFSGMFFGKNTLQRAKAPIPTPQVEADPLMIALNQPMYDGLKQALEDDVSPTSKE